MDQLIIDSYVNYANYLWNEVTNPHPKNYFYWLIGISIFFFVLELVKPWRKDQPTFRKDFWLDAFYMFFNFFLFSLIVFNAASNIVVHFFNDLILSITNFDLAASNPLIGAPMWLVLLVGFLVRDMVQWWVHRLLHKVPFLWQFHKVHHSVQQMGFAAHLRFHWMETVVYRTLEYIPLALLGIGLYDFFIIHLFTTAVGHYNHSNISIPGKVTGGIIGGLLGFIIAYQFFDISLIHLVGYQKILFTILTAAIGSFALGPYMKILFNSPEMHIWHHSKELPEDRHTGVNFGLTLAIWDYIFGTAYVPKSGKDIPLGFESVETFPENFGKQVVYGFYSNKSEDK